MTKGAAAGPPKKRFRPTFWASLCTVAGLAVLLSLGSWQLQRLAEKEELIATIKARALGAPIALPQDLSDADLDFQLVEVSGRFLPGEALRLANRTFDGKVGAHIVVPFRLDDGRGLLIDLGWVPAGYDAAGREAVAADEAGIRLQGYLRRGGWHGMAAFRPANEPAKGLFNWPDLGAMAALRDVPRAIDQVYLVLAPGSAPPAEDLPRRQPPPIDFPNNHLQYAITWYALALVLLVIYIIYHWRPDEAA